MKPCTRTPSTSPSQGRSVFASSRPSRLYTQLSSLLSPGEKNSSSPSRMQRTDTSGRPSAHRSAAAAQAAPSARSVLRNLRRAGVL